VSDIETRQTAKAIAEMLEDRTMATKEHPTIGCCGIDCGLCPRYYTDGASRCPGCGEKFEFEQKHPSCGILNCCVKKNGFEACAECAEFPCGKFSWTANIKDSFVTHRAAMGNQKLIAETGLPAFLEQQNRRIVFLNTALEKHNDGRSKGFFCLAAALLKVESLEDALAAADRGENLREVLNEHAAAEGQELKLKK
jgi:hypothetical protein